MSVEPARARAWTRPAVGWCLGLGVVALWSSAFSVIHTSVGLIGSLGTAALRIDIAALALLLVAPAMGVRRPQLRDLPLILAMGVCGHIGYQVLLCLGEATTSASTASLLLALAPISSMIGARLLLAERLTTLKTVGATISVAGLAAMCATNLGGTLTGMMLVALASVLYGLYQPLAKRSCGRFSTWEIATYSLVSAAVLSLPLIVIEWDRIVSAPPAAWPLLLYLGLGTSALAFVLWGGALERLSATAASSLLYLVPFAGVLAAWLLLSERPDGRQLTAGLIVVLGVVLSAIGARERPDARR